MRGVETELQRLEDVARGTDMVSWGLEVILRIGGLLRSFRGAHGGSAPPPSSYWKNKNLLSCLQQILSKVLLWESSSIIH